MDNVVRWFASSGGSSPTFKERIVQGNTGSNSNPRHVFPVECVLPHARQAPLPLLLRVGVTVDELEVAPAVPQAVVSQISS